MLFSALPALSQFEEKAVSGNSLPWAKFDQVKDKAQLASGEEDPAAPGVTYTGKIDGADFSWIEIAAVDLYDVYNKNQLAGDQKYKGKAILITGKIQSIMADFDGNPVVTLETNNMLGIVGCHFSGGQEKDLVKLAKGENISLAGTGGGVMMGDPELEDCYLFTTK
ncbi:MAG: OB-fold putative lipoprotein [Deltaproteobacteria bacterium]|nr:OB-fold putative lipoprotein [Deltaproteobacteria bacterium]